MLRTAKQVGDWDYKKNLHQGPRGVFPSSSKNEKAWLWWIANFCCFQWRRVNWTISNNKINSFSCCEIFEHACVQFATSLGTRKPLAKMSLVLTLKTSNTHVWPYMEINAANAAWHKITISYPTRAHGKIVKYTTRKFCVFFFIPCRT